MLRRSLIPILSLAVCGFANAQAPRLSTRWTALVDKDRPLPEYPRPQLVRPDWLNLNGQWHFTTAQYPTERQRITVPFPIESFLSGIGKPLQPTEKAVYQREFEVPANWRGKRLLLHFGAVDWEARVFVNGAEAGRHRGGYDPFTLDITRFLEPGTRQQLEVWVTDPTDSSWQPRGKQVLKPGGIFYTPTSGIWQTVWVEPVAAAGIQDLRITPDVATRTVTVQPSFLDRGAEKVAYEAFDGKRSVARVEVDPGQTARLMIPRPKLWSPDSPFLYDLKVTVRDGRGRALDEVQSYFGMRSVSVAKDAKGINRLMLNGKPVFQTGLLDQGFWPDGLYTAPTDDALRYDLEVTKRLGFNMVRKHVKVEPARWYAMCDRMGLLVWQDMPSGDRSIGGDDPDIVRTVESAANFETEWTRIMRSLYNSPSIVTWVVFNEGWGQFDTARMIALTRATDPTRVINGVTGWADRGVGDVIDYHIYPGPGSPNPEAGRAAVLGEFGGLGLPLAGHTWVPENNWGYRSYTSREALSDALVASIRNLRPLIASPGLSASVYTQTTDVETEVNGIMTYDRAIIKVDEARLREANLSLAKPAPPIKVVAATSESAPVAWAFTLNTPPTGWERVGFDDRGWMRGQGGFGRRGTPGAIVRTPWESNEIWLRREFTLDRDLRLEDAQLRIHHDEDAEVYLDGQLIARLSGYTSSYVYSPIRLRLLAKGRHVLAVHVRQTSGGQYIDAGIVDLGK